MLVAIYLTVLVLVLWAIPIAYAFQSGTLLARIEAVLLLLVSLPGQFAFVYAENALYGVAANVSLGESLVMLAVQLIVWLAALLIVMATRVERQCERLLRDSGLDPHR